MELLLLFALQLAAMGAGFAFMWRRMDALRQDVAEMRRALEARQTVRKANIAAVVNAATTATPSPNIEAPSARAARVWRKPVASPKPEAQPSGLVRGLVLATAAAAPALGFAFRLEPAFIIGAGVLVGAAMMLLALRPAYRVAAWAGALTAPAWAAAGLISASAFAHPIIFATAALGAAMCGLVYAHRVSIGPGTALVLAMSAATLALGSQIGMVSPAGIAFGSIVAFAALIGATNLKLEPLHIGAFLAALVGLFVLSGQDAAAIWYTPIAAWTGALFLGIAFIRVPELGARGATLAGTGALAPFAAIASLYAAQQGLADRIAAGGAFALLAIALMTLTVLAARRLDRGMARLKLAAWVLAAGAFASAFASIALAAPPALAAALFVAGALALIATDSNNALFRVFAGLAAVSALPFAGIAAERVLAEAPGLPAWANLALGFAAPALLAGATTHFAQRRDHVVTAAVFEIIAFALAVAGASFTIRLVFTSGAPLLQPIGDSEAGAHIALWLAAALAIAGRGPPRSVNELAACALALCALCASLIVCAYWLSEYSQPLGASPERLHPAALALPALLFGAHWAFWRGRNAAFNARVALAAGSLLGAATMTLAVMSARAPLDSSDWVSAVVGAIAFGLAIAVNFAPGVVSLASRRRTLWREEHNYPRPRRRRSRI